MAEKGPGKKMRLALVTSVIDNREGRGTALVARELLSRLLAKTSEFEFILIHHEPTDNQIYTEHETFLIPHLPAPFDRHLFREAFFWLLLRSRGIRFDIVHYMNPRIWPSYLLAPGKVMVTMHEAGIMLNLHPHSFADRVFQVTYRFLHQGLACVIAVSEFGKEEIARYCKIAKERITVIPNAIDDTFTRDVSENVTLVLKERYGIPSPYVLSVGRLDPHKNIVRLIEAYAAARARGVHEFLVLVGGRHLESYSRRVEERITELELNDVVYLAPFIPDADLALVYSGARALLYPSLHEGFGLPLLEAMACGIPVAASKSTSLPEIAGDAALLFDPENTESITESIVRITKDGVLRDIYIKRGYERVRDFSWDSSAAKLAQVYRELASR